MLLVDTREPDGIFRSLEKLHIPYQKQTLLVGDYLEDERNLVVERKTVTDFLSSYISNHLIEQLTNMENNYDENYLFISGKFESLFFQQLPTQLKHVTAESYNKMKIHILCSFPKVRIVEFPNDTQLLKGVVELFTYEGNKHLDNILRRKVSKNDVFLSQIACVPGIGLERAKRILAVYEPKELYNITEEDLKKIDGIGAIYAKKIKEVFE